MTGIGPSPLCPLRSLRPIIRFRCWGDRPVALPVCSATLTSISNEMLSLRANRMAQQKFFQCHPSATPVPKRHMLGVGNQIQLSTRRQLGDTTRRAHRRAAAPGDIVVRAADNQRLVFVAAKHFHRALPRPHRIGQSGNHLAMLTIKIRVERHAVVLDVVANVAFIADPLNFPFGIRRQTPLSARKRLCASPRCRERQRCHQIGALSPSPA